MAPIAGLGTSSDPLELFHNIATLQGWMGPVVDGDLVPRDPAGAVAADAGAGAIARFASTGDPGWPAYGPDDRREMAFEVPSRVRVDPDPLARELFSPIR
jgi:para-nitrobenzyl esterase